MSEGPLAGGSPAASHFLLPGQEKVSKEKAAPLQRPAGFLRCSPARLTNSPWHGTQDVPAALIRVWRTLNTVRLLPVRAALLGGAEGGNAPLPRGAAEGSLRSSGDPPAYPLRVRGLGWG
jgi:hypothetical protein